MGSSGKYNIGQGDPCSERQKPHVVFHLWVLVCSILVCVAMDRDTDKARKLERRAREGERRH